MEADELIGSAERNLRAGRWDGAAQDLGSAWPMADEDTKPRLVQMLEEVSLYSLSGSYNLACALLAGEDPGGQLARVTALLKRVVESADLSLAADAHNSIGEIYLGELGGQAEPAFALAHFEIAAQQGNTDAAFSAGCLLHDGAPGVAKDTKAAAHHFRVASDAGKVEATVNLGLLLAPTDTVEAKRLLSLAAAKGDARAAHALEWIASRPPALPRDHWLRRAGKPARIVPAGLRRLERLAFLFEEDLGREERIARDLVAIMLGHLTWHHLVRATRDGSPKSRMDDRCPEGAVRKRRESQAKALVQATGMDPQAALSVVHLMRPSDGDDTHVPATVLSGLPPAPDSH